MAAKAGDHDKADQHAPSPTPAAAGALHAEKAGVEKTDKKTAAEPAKPAKAGAPDKPDAPARPSSPSAKAGTPALPAAHAGGERERAMPMTSPIRTVEQASALATGYVTPMRVSVRRTGKAVQEKPKGEHPPAHEVHWSYGGSGGPANWGRLKSEYETCARGTRQSPIDIRDGARLELEPIRFDYKASPLRILDNGHTVQVNYVEGSSMTIAGERFDLKQFHFHKPAEERIDGRSFALVAHLVHQSAEGRLAVVAVLFDLGEQDNAFLRMLWPHLPLESGREAVNTAVSVDVNRLLPEARTYFTYMGSLTTPPCSEGVRWIVLKTPLEISPEQVAVFGRLYTANARPIQPSNGRLIKESM
jgi:carbonic anhydrase